MGFVSTRGTEGALRVDPNFTSSSQQDHQWIWRGQGWKTLMEEEEAQTPFSSVQLGLAGSERAW